MPVTHLTDIVVSRLKTPGIYYDQMTPAFGIRVGKHRKAWVITQGTDRQRISIGKYPQMSLADARKEAKKRLSQEPAKGIQSCSKACQGADAVGSTCRPACAPLFLAFSMVRLPMAHGGTLGWCSCSPRAHHVGTVVGVSSRKKRAVKVF